MWLIRVIGIASLALVLWTIADQSLAADLSGKVYSGERLAANLSITVEGRNIQTKTDGIGEYRLDLPPGDYVLVIRGQRIRVTISSGGTRQDIRL